jgi:glutamate formiminotransferase
VSRIFCAANWSEGRDTQVLEAMRAPLRERRSANLEVHYDGADYDHNRMVTAFSGTAEAVIDTLYSITEVAFETIDMRAHRGVHPRIGALDVCPFIVLDNSLSQPAAKALVAGVAKEIAERYHVPTFLYEKSETGKHAADLPTLRKGQYEGLHGRELNPDFGPNTASSRLGASVVGLRDWLVAANIELSNRDPSRAREIAKQLRTMRDAGDPRFAGVRALGFALPSRGLSQVSMNLTRPDDVSFDTIYDFVDQESAAIVGAELIGALRPQDLAKATRLNPKPEQIVRETGG